MRNADFSGEILLDCSSKTDFKVGGHLAAILIGHL
jgi:hypothetical protein